MSGLSETIGEHLVKLANLPGWCVVLLVATMVATLTEFTSNVATSSLLLPILAKLVRRNICDVNELISQQRFMM